MKMSVVIILCLIHVMKQIMMDNILQLLKKRILIIKNCYKQLLLLLMIPHAVWSCDQLFTGLSD